MILVALTGGIGSGKSTVSALLAERGAVVVDADAVTRRLQEPGQAVLDAMVERFGATILRDDGSLDRPAMAALAFADAGARADLEAIVHPAVQAEVAATVARHAGEPGRVVVYDVPLLAELVAAAGGDASTVVPGAQRFDAVVVVDVDTEVAVDRLVADRGMDRDDARARVANQSDRAARLALADRVVDNAGSLADLERQVDDLWRWLASLADERRG